MFRSKSKKKEVATLKAEIPFEDYENLIIRGRAEVIASPINLKSQYIRPARLRGLNWGDFEVQPYRMKLVNNGHTAILCAQWGKCLPTITGGPLNGEFIFSQLHFHWGRDDNEGSEHLFNDESAPFEMHAVFYNKKYKTHKEARAQKDGLVTLGYIFEIQPENNDNFKQVVEALPFIRDTQTSVQIEPHPISRYIESFKDYFLYWGNVSAGKCTHLITWLICRRTTGIASNQIACFRSLMDSNEDLIVRNFRTCQKVDHQVYYMNPTDSLTAGLLVKPVTLPVNHQKSENMSKPGRATAPEKRAAAPLRRGIEKWKPKNIFTSTIDTSKVLIKLILPLDKYRNETKDIEICRTRFAFKKRPMQLNFLYRPF